LIIYAELFEYRKSLLVEAQSEGIPLVRAMFLENPEDKKSWTIDDQFLFGSDIIVAPIITDKSSKRNVYLPKGEWIDLFTGKEYKGEQSRTVAVEVPLETLPVFVRKASSVAIKLTDFVKRNPPMFN
jgi:alpha-glucosidase (family GH31 glycosyl hydrolase)